MTSKRGVTDERQRVLRRMLEERRREIHEKLRSLRESRPADANDVTDIEEQSVADFVQDVDFALMQMKAETLARIDAALLRLEHGGYGVCDACGGAIAAARLRALPFAALCRECQEREEQRAAQREARAVDTRLTELLPLT